MACEVRRHFSHALLIQRCAKRAAILDMPLFLRAAKPVFGKSHLTIIFIANLLILIVTNYPSCHLSLERTLTV